MSDLKTIKDITVYCRTRDCEFCTDGIQTTEELHDKGIYCISPKITARLLKSEVVKWIKEMLASLDENEEGFFSVHKDCFLENYENESTDIDGAIRFIEYFFNISDEDLK